MDTCIRAPGGDIVATGDLRVLSLAASEYNLLTYSIGEVIPTPGRGNVGEVDTDAARLLPIPSSNCKLLLVTGWSHHDENVKLMTSLLLKLMID